MQLKDMARKPETALEAAPETRTPKEYYPHSLYLHGEDVEKLDLDNAKVGQEMLLTARVAVVGVSMSQNDRGRNSKSVTLEIREAGVEAPKRSDDEKASRLYTAGDK